MVYFRLKLCANGTSKNIIIDVVNNNIPKTTPPKKVWFILYGGKSTTLKHQKGILRKYNQKRIYGLPSSILPAYSASLKTKIRKHISFPFGVEV